MAVDESRVVSQSAIIVIGMIMELFGDGVDCAIELLNGVVK